MLRRGARLLLLAATLGTLVPVLFGSPRPMIYVEWRDVDAPTRLEAERRLRLSEPAQFGPRRWGYIPLDTSSETLRTLVRHPAIDDTDGVDRVAFRMRSSPPLSPRRGGLFPWAPRGAARALKLAAYIAALVGILAFLNAARLWAGVSRPSLLTIARGVVRQPRMAGAAIGRWVGRAVPSATPDTVGLFRILFGALTLAYVLTEPVSRESLGTYDVGGASGAYGMLVRALAANAWVVDSLDAALIATGTAFIAGVFTRVSFALFTACVILWAAVFTIDTSHHTVSALQLTMVCLLAARWGDAWSIDAWLRRRRGAPVSFKPGPVYGFALWAPGLVLGVAFAAAAAAKLDGGLSWITNATVRYHFVSDLDDAYVDWGLRLTQWHAVAVLMSAAAVTVEALVLSAAFVRSDAYRLALGAASLMLLTGFVLFQGVFWPGWWILLLGFVPWHRLVGGKHTVPREAGSLNLAQVLIVLALVVQQIYVSARGIEARPFFSTYDMYSGSYDSEDDYEAASNLVYRVVGIADGQTMELPGCVVDDQAAQLFAAAMRGGVAERERIKGLIGGCLEQRPDVDTIRLDGDRKVFNWELRRHEWRRSLDVIGPLRVDWIRE